MERLLLAITSKTVTTETNWPAWFRSLLHGRRPRRRGPLPPASRPPEGPSCTCNQTVGCDEPEALAAGGRANDGTPAARDEGSTAGKRPLRMPVTTRARGAEEGPHDTHCCRRTETPAGPADARRVLSPALLRRSGLPCTCVPVRVPDHVPAPP